MCAPLSLAADLRPVFQRMREGLNNFADSLNTNEAKSTEVLVRFQALPSEGRQQPLNLFFLMGRRFLRPKFQLWVPCATKDDATIALEDVYPFEVDLVGEQCRMGGGFALAMWASDEVARHLAQRSERWLLQRLSFSIPRRPHLPTNMVTGPIGGPVNLEKAQKVHKSKEFNELARLQARRGSRRPVGAKFGQRATASSATTCASSSSNNLGPATQEPVAPGGAGDPLDDLDEEVAIDVVFWRRQRTSRGVL